MINAMVTAGKKLLTMVENINMQLFELFTLKKITGRHVKALS